MTAPRYRYHVQRVDLVAPSWSPRSTSTEVTEQLNDYASECPARRLVSMTPDPGCGGQVALAIWEEATGD